METVSETFRNIFRDWRETGRIHFNALPRIEREYDEWMEEELAKVDALVNSDPEEAYLRLATNMSFLAAASQQKPSLISKLTGWLNQLKASLAKAAKGIGAASYSITVGFPFGVSVGVSFNP